ncbi:hypothetical protein MRX96_034776 [Rhipicephalus microplus]
MDEYALYLIAKVIKESFLLISMRGEEFEVSSRAQLANDYSMAPGDEVMCNRQLKLPCNICVTDIAILAVGPLRPGSNDDSHICVGPQI